MKITSNFNFSLSFLLLWRYSLIVHIFSFCRIIFVVQEVYDTKSFKYRYLCDNIVLQMTKEELNTRVIERREMMGEKKTIRFYVVLWIESNFRRKNLNLDRISCVMWLNMIKRHLWCLSKRISHLATFFPLSCTCKANTGWSGSRWKRLQCKTNAINMNNSKLREKCPKMSIKVYLQCRRIE